MRDDKLAEQILVDIIQTYMSLGESNVYVRDQSKKVPNDKTLRVVVGMVDAVPYSSTVDFSPITITPPDPAPPYETLQETVRIQMVENIQIDFFAPSNDAIKRRWEIIAALKGLYAMQQQEAYGFKIGRIPKNFMNTTAAEGAAMVNRFTLTFACSVWYEKQRTLDPATKEYYDTFETRVDDAKTIGETQGLFEFTIDENGVT